MIAINVHDAKTNLSKLLVRVERGEEIVIARAGQPIAKLVPYRVVRGLRQRGCLAGQIWIGEDFDAPLPPDIAEAFGMLPEDSALPPDPLSPDKPDERST